MLYKCELIQTKNNREIVKERFYKEGNSEEEIREGLEIFEWPEGKWHIDLD